MKRKTLLLIATLVALPGVTYADSPFSSLQSVHEKNTILKDLRKMCTPKGALTDEAWEKKNHGERGEPAAYSGGDDRDRAQQSA